MARQARIYEDERYILVNQQPQPLPVQKIDPYDPNSEVTLDDWFRLFEIYCNNCRIPMEIENPVERRSVFLNTIGARYFSILRRACLPLEPENFPLEDLKQILKQKF